MSSCQGGSIAGYVEWFGTPDFVTVGLVLKIWASSLPEGKIEMGWICCSRMTGPSIPSPDAWVGLGNGEAFVGMAGVSVDMADG